LFRKEKKGETHEAKTHSVDFVDEQVDAEKDEEGADEGGGDDLFPGVSGRKRGKKAKKTNHSDGSDTERHQQSPRCRQHSQYDPSVEGVVSGE
jgi:hypothetical protein